jgi:hypothetical protein
MVRLCLATLILNRTPRLLHRDVRFRISLVCLRVRSPLLTECMFVYFPPGTEMFYFPGFAPDIKCQVSRFYLEGFPHSDIFGSKVARHLPEAYRCHAASFFALSSQGIHHTPLNFLLGNLKTVCIHHHPYRR